MKMPLKVRPYIPGKVGGHDVLDSDGRLVCQMHFGPGQDEALDDAKRIVACVNWLDGIDSARMEGTLIEHLVKVDAETTELMGVMRELVKAIDGVSPWLSCNAAGQGPDVGPIMQAMINASVVMKKVGRP